MRLAGVEPTTLGSVGILSEIYAYSAPLSPTFKSIKTGYPLHTDTRLTPARDEIHKKRRIWDV
jgi:hypothetical protein